MKLFFETSHMAQWSKFLSRYPVRTYKKGENIYFKGDIPKSVDVIKSGVVKAYDITKRGEEHPVSFDVAGEIFPIGWVFEKIEKTEFFYQALVDTELYTLPRRNFLRYLRFHPRMAYEMYAGITARFISLQDRIYALEQSRASDKIIFTMLYLGKHFGGPNGNNKVHLNLPLTQQEIGNYVGLTRETTNTELNKLEKTKAITHSSKGYILNIPALKKLVE